jgi:hypothetical protein
LSNAGENAAHLASNTGASAAVLGLLTNTFDGLQVLGASGPASIKKDMANKVGNTPRKFECSPTLISVGCLVETMYSLFWI